MKGAMWESNAVQTKDIPLMRNTIYTAESELYWERLYSAPMSLPRNSMPEIPESPKYCTTDEHGSITVNKLRISVVYFFKLENVITIYVFQTRHCYGRPCADGSVVFGGSRVFVPHPTDSSLIVSNLSLLLVVVIDIDPIADFYFLIYFLIFNNWL